MTEPAVERAGRFGAADQRPSSVLELVGSDRAMSIVLSFLELVFVLPSMFLWGRGQFTAGRLREALALGRVLPGLCVASPIKLGPAGAALLATDTCLGGLQLAAGSSWLHVFDALKLNTGLRKCGLNCCQFGAGDVARLEALAVSLSIVDVSVSMNPLGRPGLRAITTVLNATTSLQRLNLSICRLQPGDVALLAGGVVANVSLRELVLDGNNVGEAGGRALATALETNSTLHVLRVDGSRICARVGDAGGRAIGAALATNTGLFQLDLHNNDLGEISGRAIAAALATNTTLCELHLSSNGDFGGSGAVALFGALRSNRALLELRMAAIGLDHTSGVALADMVRENSTLRVLELSDNRLGRAKDGSGNCSWAQVLAALKDNTGLHTLSLQRCGLSADDGEALADALEQRPDGLLRKLELSGNNGIGDTSYGAIVAACLKPGSSVASLGSMYDIGAGQETMHSLAAGLRHGNKLEVLDFLGIHLVGDGSEGSWPELIRYAALANTRVHTLGSWPELFAALAVNTRVCTLLLGDCDLTAADGQALASALQQRPAGLLRELDVRNNEGLGDDACSAIIVACLRPDSALRKLNIESSGANSGSTLTLAGCLGANHTLEELHLKDMGGAGESAWSKLFGALAVNTRLRTLSIKECGLEQGGIEALAAALRTNRVLQDLRVEDNDLGENCGQIMAGGLATNTSLRRLHFYNHPSPPGDAAAFAYCALLQTNSTLRVLSFSCAGPFSDAALKALQQAGRAKDRQFSVVYT